MDCGLRHILPNPPPSETVSELLGCHLELGSGSCKYLIPLDAETSSA